MKILIQIFFTFLISTTTVTACQCIGYVGAFIKVSKNPSLIKLTALVKVVKYLTYENINGQQIAMSMEVEIIDIYNGQEERKSFTVWGNPGFLCRPYLSVFQEGSYYVIAFSPAGWDSSEKNTDYSINACGAYWLNVNIINSTVTGDIDSNNGTDKTISLAELKLALNPPLTKSDN